MTTGPDLPCNASVELVTDHLEGALDEATRALFAAHLEECLGCRRYLEQIRTTVGLLAQTPRLELSPEARESVLEAFRARRAGGAPPAAG